MDCTRPLYPKLGCYPSNAAVSVQYGVSRLINVSWRTESMEKQYIFFRTGMGLGVFGFGIIAMIAVVVAIMVWLPHLRWLHIASIVAASIVAVLGAFKIDEVTLKKQRG
jgi:hypothetical protein